MNVFSASRLEKFASCPAAGYRRYVLGIPEPAGDALVLGRAAHAVIKAAALARRTDEEFFAALCTAVAAACDCDEAELLKITLRAEVLSLISSLPDIKVEEHFCVPLDPENPFSPEIQGYIDLWWENGDRVGLVDWKSGYKEYAPLEKHQLGLYAMHLHRATGLPVEAHLVFLRSGRVYSHLYTPENGIEEARKWALDVALDVQARLFQLKRGAHPLECFPLQPGEHCTWCGYVAACSEEGDLALPADVATPEAAQGIARRVLRLEAALEDLKQNLRRYVEAAGPVSVDGKRFVLIPTDYYKWPRDALERAVAQMREEGFDPFEVLSLTNTGLRKLGWDDEKCRALGAELVVRSPQFRHISAKS